MALRSQKGYTLVEAMVTVAIVGGLAAVSAPLLRNMTNFWRLTTARYEIERDARHSLDLMNRFLRQAQANSIVLDEVAGQPPYSRITFTTISGMSMQFYQTGNQLFMKQGTDVVAISKRLGFVAFTFPKTDDNTILSVAMTMQSPTYLGGSKALQLSIQKVRIMN